MTLTLDSASRQLVSEALQNLVNRGTRVQNSLLNFLAGVAPPAELIGFINEATSLSAMMTRGQANERIEFDLDPGALALLRAALSVQRRERAEQIEGGQQHITSASLSRALDDSLEPLNALLATSALARMVPRPIPALADFITPEGRKNYDPAPTLAPEEREPKHRILLSASLIGSDLSVYRRQCEDRRLPFAVVFADLDDFKRVNSAIGEVAVDRQILPRILAAVEAASYGHGRAYRHGGDEFVLLFPNAAADVIASLVLQLKSAVEQVTFESVDFAPRLSAGVWITVPSSHLTASELVDRASQAKAASKAAGKSRITIRQEIGSEYDERVVG
jgi:diguanylate cyclase (GGDEF)-like protein